jgi:hypothetical protein
VLLFGELPDPLDRYRSLKANATYYGYEMNIPPVFDVDGNPVFPTEYQNSIPEGTLVAVRGSMKM